VNTDLYKNENKMEAYFSSMYNYYDACDRRNEEEYKIRWNYIENNPAKWEEDEFFVQKSQKGQN